MFLAYCTVVSGCSVSFLVGISRSLAVFSVFCIGLAGYFWDEAWVKVFHNMLRLGSGTPKGLV